VNVLVALAWPNHVHHARALSWFLGVHAGGWATCPITEAGFVRVSSNVRAIPDARSPAQAIELLRHMRAVAGHVFWSDDVSPCDADGAFLHIVGYRQVTDAHLVSLAHRRDGTLATFDRGVLDLAGDLPSSVEIIP
jgi:hypothetical protein